MNESHPAPLRPSVPLPLVAALSVLAAVGCAATGYFTLFTQFARHDDEGTLLVWLKAFVDGHTLYRDIHTPYGPFFYELFGALFALTGLDVTTNASRLLTLAMWIGASAIVGVLVKRLAGDGLLAIAGMLASFGTLSVLANEPMHPQALFALLIALFMLCAASPRAGHERWAGAAAGSIVAALVLVKINVGGFAVMAVALASALVVEPLCGNRWLRRIVAAAFLALPFALVVRDLEASSVRVFAAMELLAGISIVLAARTIPADPTADRRWLVAFSAGFVAAAAAILLVIVVVGTSPALVYDGMIVEALRVRDAMIVPYPMPAWALIWSAAGVGGAATASRLLAAGSLASAVLRTIAGLVLWVVAARVVPVVSWPALAFCWVAIVPPASVSGQGQFLRVLLAALAMTESLQVYPVAGSQIGVASLPLVALGAVCLRDAVDSWTAWGVERRREWYRRAIPLATLCLVGLFAITSVALPGQRWFRAWREREPLPIPGADFVRLSPGEVETYAGLVDLLHRHGCTTFIGYPNLNSLYLWSGLPAIPPFAPGGWITGLDDESQQGIVDALRSSEVPCAIRSETRASFWLSGSGRPPHSGPLTRSITKDFSAAERIGDYWFLVERTAL